MIHLLQCANKPIILNSVADVESVWDKTLMDTTVVVNYDLFLLSAGVRKALHMLLIQSRRRNLQVIIFKDRQTKLDKRVSLFIDRRSTCKSGKDGE